MSAAGTRPFGLANEGAVVSGTTGNDASRRDARAAPEPPNSVGQ
jgi:hypothetical protein